MPTPTVTVGHVPETERRKSFSARKQEGALHPKLGQVAKAREDRDDPVDVGGFGHRKVRPDLLSMERGRTPLGKGKEQENMVQSHQDKRTRRRFKVSVGIVGKTGHQTEGLLGKATAATESRTIEFSWKGKRCERQVRQRWRNERQVGKMLEHLFGTSELEVQLRARLFRLHRTRKQAPRLVRLTRLNAQRWICVQPRWHRRRS